MQRQHTIGGVAFFGFCTILLQLDSAFQEPGRLFVQGLGALIGLVGIADPRGRALNERQGIVELFRTYHPIAKRIALLREMGYQELRP